VSRAAYTGQQRARYRLTKDLGHALRSAGSIGTDPDTA
jgi:hypothetical protein